MVATVRHRCCARLESGARACVAIPLQLQDCLNGHMKKLEGKVAVITGGNSGIGLATAKAFAAEGAAVAIVGRRRDAVDAAVEGIGRGAMGIVGDTADLATHENVMTSVRKRFGRLDIYIANA